MDDRKNRLSVWREQQCQRLQAQVEVQELVRVQGSEEEWGGGRSVKEEAGWGAWRAAVAVQWVSGDGRYEEPGGGQQLRAEE